MGGRLRQKDADSSSIARCVLCTILCKLRYEKGTIITKVNEDGLHELEKQHKAVVLLYYMEVGVDTNHDGKRCGHCKRFAPEYTQIANSFENQYVCVLSLSS